MSIKHEKMADMEFRIIEWFDSAKDYVESIEHVNMGDMEFCI